VRFNWIRPFKLVRRMRTNPRGSYNLVGLIAVLGGKLTMRGEDFGSRKDLLAVAGRVRGDLRCLVALEATALDVGSDLLAAGARGIEIFLCVSLDLRRSAPS